MAISNKTRKILWARSGNRCAICHCELVMEKAKNDPEAVVGDECHIVSKKPNGPRSGTPINTDFDDYVNLILLCKTHHKLVDDQVNEYTVAKLKAIKTVHEQWVYRTLEKGLIEQTRSKNEFKVDVDKLTALLEEVEKSDVSPIQKFALLRMEIVRRGWTVQPIIYPEFWAWLQEQERRFGRGAVYITQDMIAYMDDETAFKNLPTDISFSILNYEMGREYVIIVEIEQTSNLANVMYRTEQRPRDV